MSKKTCQAEFIKIQAIMLYRYKIFFSLDKKSLEYMLPQISLFQLIYSVFHRFRQAKSAYWGSILSSRQFLQLPQLPQKKSSLLFIKTVKLTKILYSNFVCLKTGVILIVKFVRVVVYDTSKTEFKPDVFQLLCICLMKEESKNLYRQVTLT